MKTNIYLDNAGTTPLRKKVIQRLKESLDIFGNPSSIHQPGQQARVEVENARRQLANFVNVRPEQIIFTSGGSESNNMTLRGVMAEYPNKRLLVGGTEHPCVRLTADHLGGTVIPVHQNGRINLQALEQELQKGDVALVSVMHANNETGVLNNIKQIADLCRTHNALFHTDASQTIGKIPFDFEDTEADFATLSGHKFGAPKGIGALIVKGQPKMQALITGGAQERNRRAGTENLLGIIGLGTAITDIDLKAELIHAQQLEKKLIKNIKNISENIEFIGDLENKLPHITQILLPNIAGEDAVIAMDLQNIAVSHGSACSSGKVEPSTTLLSMGYSAEQAARALRISTGFATTMEDIETFTSALKTLIK